MVSLNTTPVWGTLSRSARRMRLDQEKRVDKQAYRRPAMTTYACEFPTSTWLNETSSKKESQHKSSRFSPTTFIYLFLLCGKTVYKCNQFFFLKEVIQIKYSIWLMSFFKNNMWTCGFKSQPFDQSYTLYVSWTMRPFYTLICMSLNYIKYNVNAHKKNFLLGLG